MEYASRSMNEPAPNNHTICARRYPSAGKGVHFRGKSDRLVSITE